MASPQKDNGYTAIANETMEALSRFRIPGEQRQVLDFILRKTYGFNKKEDAISLSQFVKGTGLKKPNIVRSLSTLLSKKIIAVIKNDNKPAHVYKFNKNYDVWKPVFKKKVVIKSDNKSLSKVIPTKVDSTKAMVKEFKFKVKVPIPNDIFLTDKMRNYVIKQGCNNGKHADNLFEDFRNHFKKTGKKWQDWTFTFYTWVRNDKKLYNPDKYKKYEYVK